MNYLNFFKHKKVFLTGHTGFKGAWLLKWLDFLGADVVGYALAPKSKNNLYSLINGKNLCQSVIADISDLKKLESVLLQTQPDIIFHLAAQSLVRHSYEFPLETYQTNVLGTANLLQATQKLDKRVSIVIITTDKVYENREWVYPYREEDALGGFDPYSSSKACVEILTKSFYQSFFSKNDKVGIATARAGNVIGGGDWAKDRIIPDAIRALAKNLPITIRNPKAVRPWQHVLEPLGGYLALAAMLYQQPKEYSQAYNFGPAQADTFTVLELVKKVIKKWGSGTYQLPTLLNQPHEANLLKLDISKAQKELDWHPILTVKQTISKTIDWYCQFIVEKADASQLLHHQIKDYSALLSWK